MKQSRGSLMDTVPAEEAARWFFRAIADDLSSTECRTYLNWLRESPRNVRAILQLSCLHEQAQRLFRNSLDQEAAADFQCNDTRASTKTRTLRAGRHLRKPNMSNASEARGVVASDAGRPSLVDVQAMTWLIELKTRKHSQARWIAFETWIAADPSHEETYCHFERRWERFESDCLMAERQAPNGDVAESGFARLFKLICQVGNPPKGARCPAALDNQSNNGSRCKGTASMDSQATRSSHVVSTASRSQAPIVFISYESANDETAVREIASRLRAHSFDPLIYADSMPVGSGLQAMLETLLALCSFVLVICSSRGGTCHSLPQHTLQVLKVWESRMRDRSRLVPVRLDQCRIHAQLNQYACVDWFAESGWPRLMVRLGASPRSRDFRSHARRSAASRSGRNRGMESSSTSAQRPSLDRKPATFPQEIEALLACRQAWQGIEQSSRDFMTRISCRLEPIVQLGAGAIERSLLGFQCLALGPDGERFSALLNRCAGANHGFVRMCAAIAAAETIQKLHSDATCSLQGRSRLKFLLHLDSCMLDSDLLEPFLSRYADILRANVMFEVSESTANEHYLRLHRMGGGDLQIGYVATDFDRWSCDASSVLRRSIKMTKVGYVPIRDAMRRSTISIHDALSNMRRNRISGLPLIVSGLNRRRDVQESEALCSDGGGGDTFGQGDALDAAPRWNAKTPPLRSIGVRRRGRALLQSSG